MIRPQGEGFPASLGTKWEEGVGLCICAYPDPLFRDHMASIQCKHPWNPWYYTGAPLEGLREFRGVCSMLSTKKPVLRFCICHPHATVHFSVARISDCYIIQIFYFYDYVKLQLKCVRNESVISFSEKILAGNRSDLVRIVLVTLWYAYEDFTLYL